MKDLLYQGPSEGFGSVQEENEIREILTKKSPSEAELLRVVNHSHFGVRLSVTFMNSLPEKVVVVLSKDTAIMIRTIIMRRKDIPFEALKNLMVNIDTEKELAKAFKDNGYAQSLWRKHLFLKENLPGMENPDAFPTEWWETIREVKLVE